MPFRLGPMELVIILAIVLLFFGATRLPKLGEGVGKGIREFKKSISGEGEQPPTPEVSGDHRGPAPRQ